VDARTATPVASSLFSSQLNQSFGGRSDAAAAACSVRERSRESLHRELPPAVQQLERRGACLEGGEVNLDGPVAVADDFDLHEPVLLGE
jgi:hypothetical protein